ncbi:MAG: TCR/Tet family MFS transporter [Deinococcales bacterium]
MPNSEASKRQASMMFILITLFIDILGLGLIIPILPELIKNFTGGSESEAARYFALIASSYAVMQFIFAPLLGALSDRFGRRPILLLSLLGLGIDYFILVFAPNLTWLFIGRIIAGLAGASFTTANAYIADISTPQNRAQNFGLVGMAFGLGFIFGPALGGILGNIWIRLPFLVAGILSLLNWLYGFFILPESLSPEKRNSQIAWKKANPVGSIFLLRNYPLVGGLAIIFILISLAQRGLETVWVLYTSYKFNWSELQNGLALTLVGVMAALVQGFLIRLIVPKIGERQAVLLGLSISVFSFAAYGLATKGWMMLIVIVISGLSGIAGPAVQSMVAGSVEPQEQGKVQGALTSLVSLSSIAAPLIFTGGLFAYFTSDAAPFKLPGAPFFVGALLFLISIFLMQALFKRYPMLAQQESSKAS